MFLSIEIGSREVSHFESLVACLGFDFTIHLNVCKYQNPHYWLLFSFTDLDDGSVESNLTNHMVRGTWFSNNHDVFHYGLPSPLLDYLRKAQNFCLDGCSVSSIFSVYLFLCHYMSFLCPF